MDYDKIIDKRIIDESVLNRTHISAEEMKQIIKDTMKRIQDSMSTKNFLRWMKGRGIRKDLRKMIVRVCNGTNEPSFASPSRILGYASMRQKHIKREGLMESINMEYDKTVTLKEANDSRRYSKDTATHEFLHIISSSGKMSFCTFLDEGLTEYITKLIKNDNSQDNAYRYNVAIVERLHTILGDKLIKAYFTGIPTEIEQDIFRLLDSKEKALQFFQDINQSHDNEFLRNLLDIKKRKPDFQPSKYGGKYKQLDSYTEEQAQNGINEIDQRRERIIATLHTLAIAKMKERFQNYEFYRDGQLDINAIGSSLIDFITAENKMLKTIGMPVYQKDAYSICDAINEMMIQYTHIGFGKTPEELERIKQCGFRYIVGENGKCFLEQSLKRFE